MTILYLLIALGVCKNQYLANGIDGAWTCVHSQYQLETTLAMKRDGTAFDVNKDSRTFEILDAPVSYAFGISAETALEEMKELKPGTFRLLAGKCASNTRQMSNLCTGDCENIYKACDFKPASVSTKTITVTEFSEGEPTPRP